MSAGLKAELMRWLPGRSWH